MNPILHDDENKAYLKDWIVQTFSIRECVRFVKSKTHSDKCGCGRRYEEHRRLHHQGSQLGASHSHTEPLAGSSGKLETWRIQDCTATYPTNAFGTVEFQGADALTPKAEYIRLSFDTKPQNIIKLLKNYWQLELPKLIISVHGGIANFGLQPKLKQAIQRGLINVANTSHIWIITAGTDTGVVKHVGEMLREYLPKTRTNLVVIGIAPWGVVNDRESLIGGNIEVPYFSTNRTVNLTNSFNLNSCHSHLLLVDDGTVGKYGCEISLRRRLERYLSRHKSEILLDFDMRPTILDVTIEEKITLQNHHTIPLVCLVIEGGTNTIQTVLINVNDKPPVPVVVCDGSGRAADLIAFTHRYAQVNPFTNKPLMESDVKEQLILTIMKTFAYTKDQAEQLFVQLMSCVSNKELISVYRLGDEGNQEIDIDILTASLKVIDIHLSKQLEIIMGWNRPDIAKKYIYLQGHDSEMKILEERMFDAFAQDKIDFVKLYLDYGVNLRKFLTFKRLKDLYNYKKGPYNTLLLIVKDVVKRMDSNYHISLIDIGLVIEKLVGNGYVSEYSKKDFKNKYLKFEYKNSCIGTKVGTYLFENTEKDETFKYPYNELLIWAILMKRHKMAMFLCKKGEECLAKALIAVKLNKALAKEAELDELDSEISDEFKKYAEEFGSLALGLLEKCYKEDDDLTAQLLTYDLVNWSHWTCLSLAVSANLKDFLSHAACQALITDLWMGGMKIRKYITYKVIAALLFPPFIFFIQFKSASELQYMPQTQEEYEQELENQDSVSQIDFSERNSMSTATPRERLPSCQPAEEQEKCLADQTNDVEISRRNTAFDDLLKLELNKSDGNNLGQIIEMYDAQNFASAEDYNNLTKPHEHEEEEEITTIQNPNKSRNKRRMTVMNFLVKNKGDKLRFGKRIYEFYNAPITKFWQNAIIFIVFLLCQAYMVLIKTPPKPSVPEIFFLIYIFTYGLDKLRELLQADSPRFSGKIKVFFSKIMNLLDVFFIATVAVAIVFRFQKADSSQKIARLIYCVNTIYWIIKLMELLLINKYIGPLIIIASRMLVDLFNFVIILLILLMSFGLSRQAIKFPNEEFQWELVKNIFLEPYFMLYGEVYADTIDPPCDDKTDPNSPQCQAGHWITPLTMTAFMIVACLLFLTVLIASFNNTFARISRQSDQFWKFNRYHLVTTFEAKPLLAPPLIILSHVFMIFKYAIRFCLRKKIKFDRKLKAFLSEDMVQRVHDFEENCVYQYSCDLDRLFNDLTEEKVGYTKNRVDGISERIDDIFFKENMTKLSLYKVELRLQKLEEFTYETVNQLNNIANLLKLKQVEASDVNTESQKARVSRRSIGEDSAGGGSAIYRPPISRQLSKSSINKKTLRVNPSSDLIGQLTPTSGTNPLMTSSIGLLARRRRRFMSENSKAGMGEGEDVHRIGGGGEEINIETKYLKKISQKIMGKKKKKKNESDSSSSSSSSISSSDVEKGKSPSKETKPKIKIHVEDYDNKANEKPSRKSRTRRKSKRESSSSTSSSSSSSSSSTDSSDSRATRKILADIFRNQLDEQQQILSLAASQACYNLDQYTIHPYVYLHSLIKPPLAEYTSITDSIDTTNLDRPSSPTTVISASLNKSNVFFANLPTSGSNSNQPKQPASSSTSTSLNKKLTVGGEYNMAESNRSIVARQESEILRLVEESQQVIISQMLNKLVNHGRSNPDATGNSSTPFACSSPDFNPEEEAIRTTSSLIDKGASTTGQKVMFNVQEVEEEDELEAIRRKARKKSSLKIEEEDEDDPRESVLVSEENETSKKFMTIQASKKSSLAQQHSTSPLTPINRNMSQLLYAQTQAQALCLEDESMGPNSDHKDD